MHAASHLATRSTTLLCALGLFIGLTVQLARVARVKADSSGTPADLNCDGVVDLADVEPFTLALLSPHAWCTRYGRDVEYLLSIADFDRDGELTVHDVDSFCASLGLNRGAEPGQDAREAPSSGRQDVYWVDLDIDSDNDNGTALPERDLAEDDLEPLLTDPNAPNRPAKYVLFNDDDDDGDGIADCNDLDGVVGEDDLVPMILEVDPRNSVLPCATTLKYCLSYDAGRFRVWAKPRWTGESDLVTSDPNCALTVGMCSGSSREYRVWVRGDMDAGGACNFGDINAFVTALADYNAWLTQYILLDPEDPNHWFPDMAERAALIGDMNGDGILSLADINPFIAAIYSGERRYVPVWFWVEGISATTDSTDETAQPRLIVAHSEISPGGSCLADAVKVECHRCGDASGYPLVPKGYEDRCPEALPDSRCWFLDGDCDIKVPAGYPLHLNVIDGFGPGDLPPRKLDMGLSSSPLVARETVHSRMNPHAERALHHDAIDLVTGVPLLQAIDFELPFGSAVFRHVRTYAEGFEEWWLAAQCGDACKRECGLSQFLGRQVLAPLWDWNGRNWMMSENPILLVDAAYQDITEWVDDPGFGQRVCYFIPDAHHAIPFIDEAGTGEYTAPSWFDATLTHDGGKVNGEWGANRPTWFQVRTNRGALIYTFTPHYEDLWTPAAGSLWPDPHAHPRDPQYPPPDPQADRYEQPFGLPYYAIVNEIRDNYGNRVEYTYGPFRTYGAPEQNFNQNPNRCTPCCQNCNAKGQLQAIKLRAAPAAGESVGPVKWTLLYTYRTFGATTYKLNDPNCVLVPTLDVLQETMLYSIHVYEGDVAVRAEPRVLRFHEHFAGLSSFDDYDAVEQELYAGDGALPSNWVLRTQYTHEENNDCESPPDYESIYANAPAGSQYRALYDNAHCWGPGFWGGYLLLKASTTRRGTDGGQAGTAPETTEHTVYRYDQRGWNGGTVSRGFQHLATMWSGKACAAVLKHQLGWSAGDLVGKDPNECVFVDDPNSAAGTISVPLKTLADLTFARQDLPVPDSANLIDSLADFVPGDPEHRTHVAVGVQAMQTPGEIAGEQREWRFYRLHQYPDAVTCDRAEYANTEHTHTLYRWPYRYDQGWTGGPAGEFAPLPFHAPFHIMAIDELDPNQTCAYNACTKKKIAQRRVVEMNPAGFVLSDTTWDLTPDNYGDVIARQGFREQRFYDADGRVAMIGSKGWGSEDNLYPSSQGLVRVFKYYPTTGRKLGELLAVGVRAGTGAVTLGEPADPNVYCDGAHWIQAYARDPLRPSVITQEARYATPRSDITFDAEVTTNYDYTYADPNSAHSAVTTKSITRPAVPGRDGTPAHSFEKYVYDTRGNLQWTGVGSETEFFISYTGYNDYGQPVLAVVDVAPGYAGVQYPAGWQRLSSTSPLNATSTWTYDPIYGPVKMTYPNGRETHLIYENNPNDPLALTAWEYRDVVPPAAGGGTCQYLSPIKCTEMAAGKVLSVKEIKWNDAWGTPPYPPSAGVSYAASDVISETYPEYDPSGQMVGMSQGGHGAWLSSTVSYYGGNLVAREQSPDGTITRYTYDSLARLERTFRGTSDTHCAWGAIDCADPCAPVPNAADNMLLVEKRYYGEGVTDADELVTIRHYRDEPANQYLLWDPNACAPGESHPSCTGWWIDGVVPNEDEIGWTTDYVYDWRMRPCGQVEYGPHEPNEPPPLLRQTFTWYDNLDRAVIVAEYGPEDGPGTLNPSGLGITWPESAAVITAAAETLTTTGPLSLTEYCYNARGQTEETRQWRLVDGSPVYTATWTFYDHGDRPVEVHSPNAPAQKYTYDAKGRQVLSETVASDLPDGQGGSADVPVASTATIFDANDRAILTTHTEFDGVTPIDSFVRNWYDLAGRVIATANYGTNQDTYSADGLPPDPNDPSWPPIGTADVLVTEFEYDAAGRQKTVRHPDGTATSTEYDALGRVLLTVENVDDAGNPPVMQITAYEYGAGGQLVSIAGVAAEYFQGATPQWTAIDWMDLSDPLIQITRFEYNDAVVRGSVIVNWDSSRWAWRTHVMNGGNWGEWTAESANRAQISDVIYPDGKTLSFTYYSDGAVASRRDSRGNALYYKFDPRGQLTDVWIDDAPYYYTYPQPPAPWRPTDRVQHLHYTYTADKQLESATAYNWDETGSATVIAQSICAYDPWQNLQGESQQHFGLVTAQSPLVSYEWDYAGIAGGNFNRLTDVAYPSGTPVHLDYGSAGSVDNALNRVCGLTDGTAGYAAFAYIGTGRRVFSSRGNGVLQSFGSGGDYDGLDPFGRVIDLNFVAGGQTVHRYQYGYDVSGNRLYARVTQATINGVDHENDRSQAHAYDPLQRLIQSGVGRLAADNSAIVPDPTVPLKRDLGWQLDDFGNWAGDGATPGFYRDDDLDGDGDPDTMLDVTHTVNAANALTTVATDPGTTQPIITDLAGNLVWDGEFFYHYDGLNRLVQVNLADQLNPSHFAADGRLIYLSPTSPPMGRIVAKYAYDALGRLSRSQRFDHLGGQQVADFYYDGVRRIEEVELTTPATGDPTTVVRDYVYGPEYVDELVCQVDYAGGLSVPPVIWYYLQDANYNVVALTGAGGAVVTQFTYEPYGTLVAADRAAGVTGPRSAAGHQGLFFERLYKDCQVADQPLTGDTRGLYYMRNRWYRPELGRPLQMDMNESASLVLAAMAMNGETLGNFVSAFAATGHYGDGLNLYQYAGSNPVILRDPAGLNPWDEPYDDVVETLTGIYAARTSAAMDFYRFFKCMAVTAGTMVIESMVCALVPGGAFLVGMHHMALAAANIDENGLTWGNALEFAAGAAPFAGKAIGGFFGVLGEMRGARAMKGTPGPYAVGAFSIFDWSGYPSGVPRPQGPLVLLEGEAYRIARDAGDRAAAAYRAAHPAECVGKQVHHIKPIKFGGNPTDPANFAIVDDTTHVQLNKFWQRHQRDAEGH